MSEMRLSVEETNEAITRLATSTMPTVQAGAVWVQALNAGDAPDAMRLYQQAIDMSVACGARQLEENLRGSQMGLLAESIDVDTALTLFTKRVNAWQKMGDDYTVSPASLVGPPERQCDGTVFGVSASAW